MTRTRAAEFLRELPSVGSLLDDPGVQALAAQTAAPRPLLLQAVRDAIARVREAADQWPANGEWADLVAAALARLSTPSLRPVINATGVVLHTNLGRAPLAPEALAAVQHVARGYSTLEYDLASGERGARSDHCVALLRDLSGAEDALVVNNCAGALLLTLNTLAAGKDVVLSRGELIEIGGSFRIPEIMARSSARLVEVGTTNRTHPLDYRSAVTERTAALVKVHRSNFVQTGYTAEATLAQLAALGAEHSLPVVFDLGSGLLIGLERYGFPEEPTIGRAIAAGASVVLSSGDKLLGGPQAGIVVGSAGIVARMRTNPLARALRVDKLTIAALEATLRLYRDGDTAVTRIPTLAMLCAPVEKVRERAASVAAAVGAHARAAEVVESTAAVGAGAFPAHEIPSAAVALRGPASELAALLRVGVPPVVGRIRGDTLLLDMRSVPPQDDQALIDALHHALPA